MTRRELVGACLAAAGLPPQWGWSQAPGMEAASWKPRLFSAAENTAVVAMTETLIPATDTPGAKAALVNRYLDLLLSDGSEAARIEFLGAVRWIESQAQKRHTRVFAALTNEQQNALLRDLESGAAGEDGVRQFRHVKGWTARVYYATEIGFRELNKGGRAPGSYGCVAPERA